MNKSFFILCLAVIFMYGCQPKKNTPQSKLLNNNWSFKSLHGGEWKTATVPGNVFTDLLDHKLIENPYILNNEEKVQWVSDSSWVYKSSFTIDEKKLSKKHHEITFDGLDTYANVFLNDSLILEANNAFRTYTVDVQSILNQENQLRIEFLKTSLHEESEKAKLDYELPPGNRVFTRKAQFQYGWDWGPILNTSGIWKNISLKSWDDIIIRDIYISQGMITETDASLDIQLTITSDEAKEITISAQTEKLTFAKKVQLEKGTYDYTLPASIEHPKLWWPYNIGEPYLYDFTIQASEKDIILDKKKIKHGIRTIKLHSEPDSIGQEFYFTVNDVPVFMKGANYIPQNSFQNKVTDQHYDDLLSDAVDANMNMLRVWGGGIYENDIFYDLCDEKGILVWQDFMFACAMYPSDEDFLKNVEQEAFDQVVRLRNHASIALWCGNNENSEAWHRWGWQTDKTEAQKEEIWGSYLKVFDSILPYTVDRLSQTSYWESSPKYGRGNPKYKTEGDAHDWWVWHDEMPFETFEKNVPRFMSEFGFQSYPSIEAINYINQLDTLNLHTDALLTHQKHPRGFKLIKDYMLRDYPETHNDLEYVYLSQLTQAKGMTLGIEAHRRSRPYNMGTLYWQLNDCWPVISWSGIDSFGNWKALHYKTKRSFENLLISPTLVENEVTTYIVNDNLQSQTDTLFQKIIDFKGKELWSEKLSVTTEANSSNKVNLFSLEEMVINPSESMLVSSFKGETSYFYFEKPKDLLLPEIEVYMTSIEKIKGGYNISISSDFLLKDVFLTSTAKGKFSDNFFDVLPNGEKVIFFETESTKTPELKITTLNTVSRSDQNKKQSYKTDSK